MIDDVLTIAVLAASIAVMALILWWAYLDLED